MYALKCNKKQHLSYKKIKFIFSYYYVHTMYSITFLQLYKLYVQQILLTYDIMIIFSTRFHMYEL